MMLGVVEQFNAEFACRAAAALTGLLANTNADFDPVELARDYADAMIAELDKDPT